MRHKTASLLLLLVLMAEMTCAECIEYKIVETGDSVEVICVGPPPTESEKTESDKQNAQDEINAIIDCFGSLSNYREPQEKRRQEIICKKMTGGYDLQTYLVLKAMKAGKGTEKASRDTRLSAMQAELASQKAQMDAQRAAQQVEMQRKQAELQRMQQQQRFDKIWGK